MVRLIAAFLTTLFLVLTASLPAQAQGQALMCVYKGNGSDGRKRMPEFERMLGRRADCVIDFVAFDSWASFDGDGGWGVWGWKGSGYRLVESVPLTVKGTSLADVAAGKQDEHFARLAKALVSNGFPDAYVRLGWEFNGGWYPWSFKDHETDYAAAFRHVVSVMRAASGQRFRFVWCPAQGMQQQWPDWSWPGDDVIDVIGLDVYNQSWAVPVADKAALWNNVVGSQWGVRHIVAFAAKHGKPYAFPEWGTGDRPDGHGGGDDAFFIRQMAPFVAKAEFAGLWDYNAGDYNSRLSAGERPKAAAAFVEAFGGASPGAAAPSQPQSVETSPLVSHGHAADAGPSAALSAAIAPGGQVVVTAHPDRSATLTLSFPPTPSIVTYAIRLSQPRQLGFGGRADSLKGSLWNGGGPFRNFTWSTKGGHAQIYVAPL